MVKILKYYNFSSDIILASESPRRRELLSSIGITFEVIPSNIDETAIHSINPSSLVKKLSLAKAKAVFETQIMSDKIIIAADTIVYRHRLYGKPASFESAINMLEKLSGKWHNVYTGVTVLCGKEEKTFAVHSKVKLKKIKRSDIEKYLVDCNPLDKAGSYGIQDKQIVEKYKGSYTNIVGLPMEKLQEVLGDLGVTNGND